MTETTLPRYRLIQWQDPQVTAVNPLRITGFWLIFGLHLVVALYYKQVVGLDIAWREWDGLWQTIPADLLRSDLWQSLWHYHAQPPLFNLFGAFLLKLFYPHHLEAMHFIYIVLGSLLAGMVYRVLWALTNRARLSFVTAVLLALNPALFLYEAYPLYDLPTAFLVMLSIFCIAIYRTNPRQWPLVAFVVTLNLLVLTRSFYHLLILFVSIPFVLFLARGQRGRLLPVLFLVSLLSVGWYAKNEYRFGFFGSSSWQGIGLWKIVGVAYSADEMAALVEQGLVSPAVANLPEFSPPSLFVPYGFTATTAVPVLAQDDYNNINILAISQMYNRSALNVLKQDPGRYALTVILAYMVYTSPPSRFYHLTENAARMGVHEQFVSGYLLGQRFIQRYSPLRDETMGSWLAILLPVNFMIYLLWVFKQNRLSPGRWRVYLHTDAVMVWLVFMIVYTTAVGITLEYIENVRFQFLVEQPIWIFMVVTTYRIIRPQPNHSPSQM
ncbi:MAG TPA: hypothetical protein PLD25_05885 [Chloroflexota bacterium]|nr:hypothetical protein [Chloroflexota bacterium]